MANTFYLDASALAKRYIPEKGSALVDAIVDTVPANRICVLNIGTGEVVSILVRKRNAAIISPADFGQAVAAFDIEFVRSRQITKVPASNRLVTSSFPLIFVPVDCRSFDQLK